MECIECLHHWLGSGIVEDVLTAMNSDGLIVIMIERRMAIFQRLMKWQLSLMILYRIFMFLFDLSVVVCSIAIRNIKTRQITCEIDEL